MFNNALQHATNFLKHLSTIKYYFSDKLINSHKHNTAVILVSGAGLNSRILLKYKNVFPDVAQ